MPLVRRSRPVLAVMACALALAAALTPAHAAERATKSAPAAPAKAAAPAVDPAQEAAMAEMMKLATPGPQHELLKRMAGDWTATVKLWTGPGDPAVSQGTSENRLVLDGRYLEQHFHGTMMGDQPFEGYGLTGFDNGKKRYNTFWVDNTSTEMATGLGDWDEASKTLTANMTGSGPGGQAMTMRNTTKLVDDDTCVFSAHATVGGQERLLMEITYKRKK